MRVLIVEDQQAKARQLATAVEDSGAENVDLVIIPDLRQAKAALKTGGWDLMLLDMQLPLRFDKAADAGGGRELLRWLLRREIAPPTHIVGVTAYDLDGEVTAALQGWGIPLIRYVPTEDAWASYVRGLALRVDRNLRTMPQTDANRADVVLLTAVQVETEAAARVFDLAGPGELRLGANWLRSKFKDADGEVRSVALAQAPQMGLAPITSLTHKAISGLRPKLLVMCGICAGVRGQVPMGTIVVPSSCWNYQSGKIREGELQPDPRAISLGEQMSVLAHAGARNAPMRSWRDNWPGPKPDEEPGVVVAPAASGSAVVASSDVVDSVQGHSRKLTAIDMEAYGFYYACANSGLARSPMFLAAKAVVDFADEQKADDFQHYGAHMSAAFARWVAENCSYGD